MLSILPSRYRNLKAARPLNGRREDIIKRLQIEFERQKLKNSTAKLNGLTVNNEKAPLPIKDSSSKQQNSWKNHVPFKAAAGSWETVRIQSVDLQANPAKMFVTPSTYAEILDYLKNMTEFYLDSGDSIKHVDPEGLKVGDLIIYPADDEYLYRAEVLSISPKITLRLIDFGGIVEYDTEKEAYPALPIEKNKLAFGLEVFVKNPEVLKEMKDEKVTIKIVLEKPVTVLVQSKDDDAKKSESCAPSNGRRFINNKKIYADSVVRRRLTTGSNLQLKVLDCSNFKNLEITVCINNEQNAAFYSTLKQEIKEYCDDNMALLGYTPEVNECILVNCGSFFRRATCLSISQSKAKVIFFDYGNVEEDVDVTKIMKIPAKLLYNCLAVTCKLIVNGIEQENYEKMKAKLENRIITAKIVDKIRISPKYQQYHITIDPKHFEYPLSF